ncbi:hypothetical protein OAR33_00545, partial [bacterium]|nr:hypothetical protein [bacterium]
VQGSTQYMGVLPYGMDDFEELFTDRQLHMLDALRSEISAIRSEVESAALAAGFHSGGESLEDGGSGAGAYADAVLLLLTMVFGKQLDLANTLCRWEPDAQCPRNLFGRQAIPMVWDFAESNVLGSSSGSWRTCLSGVVRALERSFAWVETGPGVVRLVDARHQDLSQGAVVSTDPPYYDNVPYADLSDFFYGWSRALLYERFPDMTKTLETPKSSELVAFAHRQGSKEEATSFFMNGMSDAVSRILAQSRAGIPVTIYYAFKQGSGVKGASQGRAGWESFLEALMKAGASVTATWPLRTENKSRMRGMNSNALASSILISCRERPLSAGSCTRADFVRELRRKIHVSLAELKQAAIAPVDLRQAALGPGMAVYSKYTGVIESDGSPMTMNEALAAIQAEVDEALTEQDAEYDPITRFAAVWFEQHGFAAGDYGTAQTLATAQNISVDLVVDAGLLEAQAGKARLLRIDELEVGWEPETDRTPTIWEMTHHLCRRHDEEGVARAGDLARRLGHQAEAAKELAIRLFLICDGQGWSDEAQPYNRLGTAWSDLQSHAGDTDDPTLYETS